MTDAALYPSLAIRFVARGFASEAFALVDTGFDGYLVVPNSVVSSLRGPGRVDRIRTASGEIVFVPVYRGTVELADLPGVVPALIIALGDEYLLGLAMLHHYRVIFDHGQRLIVEP